MKSKNKSKNCFGKLCPECGEFSLVPADRKVKKDGVEYTKKIMECEECGFTEEFHISPKRFKDVFNPHW